MGAVVDVEAPLDPGGGPDGGVGSGMLAAIVELVDLWTTTALVGEYATFVHGDYGR